MVKKVKSVEVAWDPSDQTVIDVDYWPSEADCYQLRASVGDIARNVWRGLTPLKSTRSDIERLFGSAKDSIGETLIYETSSERVDVSYSEGGCKGNKRGRWNVPANTVVEIKWYPRTTILLSHLSFDASKYLRAPDPSIPNWWMYIGEPDGVIVQTKAENGCEIVKIVSYFPSVKDKHLRCP